METLNHQPRLAVAICTHDRRDYLRRALASLSNQTLAPELFEVLVVDNASRDGTHDTVASLQATMPNLRYAHEPRLGLSNARNTASHEARAPLIAYLDDDAVATPGWAAAIVTAFASARPTPGAVGGPIDPIWESERPEWLPDELVPYLTVLDHGPSARAREPRREPIFGAHLAFAVAALREVGGFDARLGRVGQALLSGEETLILRRLARAGRTIHYTPSARVGPHVPAERLTPEWFVERAYQHGRSVARLQALEQVAPWQRVARGAARLFGLSLQSVLPPMGSRVGSPARHRLYQRCRRATLSGWLQGLREARLPPETERT